MKAYSYWSKLDGDGELTWGPDALLTPLGQSQALNAKAAWETELNAGIPVPQKFYSSPLRRALDTWTLTFTGANSTTVPANTAHTKRRVLILEVSLDRFQEHGNLSIMIDHVDYVSQNCREQYGVHTCDLRSSLSTLRTIYPPPTYTFEPGFAENDPLWTPDERETTAHVALRATEVLNFIFAQPETCGWF